VAAALAPYVWRGLTERMVARMVLGAVDRHTVLRFVTGVPGTHVGALPRLEPVAPDDARVPFLMRALSGRQWRRWPLDRVCAALLCALESWQADPERPDPDLRRLPEGR
jgi:hypothetical protein